MTGKTILSLLEHAGPLEHERAKLRSPPLIRPHGLATQEKPSRVNIERLRRFLGHKVGANAWHRAGWSARRLAAHPALRGRLARCDRKSI